MPLTKIQSGILRLLAAHRDPESYVGGSTPLNRNAPRYSSDIDVFHDREERVATAAREDAGLLEESVSSSSGGGVFPISTPASAPAFCGGSARRG